MKKYFIFAASALALASCSSDDYLGNNPGNENGASSAINFGGTTGKTTRAPQSGATAAASLDKQFVVYGYKTSGGNPSTVYDYYTLKYNGQINQAEGNTQGWNYVGETLNMLSTLPDGAQQTIKYWDYTASQYDFIAFSLGKLNGNQSKTTEDGKLNVSPITTENGPKYSITGSAADLAQCFIADRVTAKSKLSSDEENKKNLIVKYQDDVQFNFRSLATKVRIGLFETINGYSVKNVKFYTAADTKANPETTPTLYAGNKNIPAENGKGTMNISFGSNDATQTNFNQAKVEWNAAEGTENSSTISFKNLAWREKQSNEKTGTEFLGRSTAANDVSTTDYKTTLPGTTVGPLTLKVDYTLESIDGSGEEINVTGATATIPAEYTQWKPNYAYTYIFKISEKTNGSTGTTDDPAGLYPISFDAIVTETEEGQQNTITIVDNKSITTYAKGEQNNEYKKGSNIYVSISGQTLSADNSALYTAKLDGAQNEIPETLVALCLKDQTGEGPWTLENNGNKLTVTKADGLNIANEIAAADAVDGNAITGNFAKFTPDAAGTYVFQYTYTEKVNGEDVTKKAYKVIKVVA